MVISDFQAKLPRLKSSKWTDRDVHHNEHVSGPRSYEHCTSIAEVMRSTQA